MEKLIEFIKSLFIKSAEALSKEKVEILKTFTEAADKLKALNAKIDATALKHDANVAIAQAKIDLANAEKAALNAVRKINENIADKIEALLK